eukprot:6395470-Amphidinium_carterae.2
MTVLTSQTSSKRLRPSGDSAVEDTELCLFHVGCDYTWELGSSVPIARVRSRISLPTKHHH